MSAKTDIVDTLVEEMKKKPFSELRALPDRTDKQSNKRQSVAIWCDKSNEPAEVKVVVQLYERRFLGMGLMYAQGFIMTQSGDLKPLTQDDLYNFS